MQLLFIKLELLFEDYVFHYKREIIKLNDPVNTTVN